MIMLMQKASCLFFRGHHFDSINCILSFSVAALVFSASMESNRGQNGIQLLLAAEQEAQRIVNAARAGIYLCRSEFWFS